MKTYADTCIERAEKAPSGPWRDDKGTLFMPSGECFYLRCLPFDSTYQNIMQLIAHARTDVPELARRLQRACEVLRDACFEGSTFGKDLANELEALPGEK